jgi:hypothetical protein
LTQVAKVCDFNPLIKQAVALVTKNSYASYEGLIFNDQHILTPEDYANSILHELSSAGKVKLERRRFHPETRDASMPDQSIEVVVNTSSWRELTLSTLLGVQGSFYDPFYQERSFFNSTGRNCTPRKRSFKKLATVNRIFGLNYFHHTTQTFPALLCLTSQGASHTRSLFDQHPDLQLLVYPDETAINLALRAGIPRSRLVLYEPCCVYFAVEL